jgi:hypothetical protein
LPYFRSIVAGPTRRKDQYGSGQFGVTRGHRSHEGLDLVVGPGESIFSPIDGVLVREAQPYAGDSRYQGVVINGEGNWLGYEIKLFYVSGIICGPVRGGQLIGYAQDLSLRYLGITNHIHIEVRNQGRVIGPMEMFGICF